MEGISYARFSTDRQSESSVDDQLALCRQYAAARGWRIIAEYSDRGISGAAIGNRPGVRAAIDAARSGDVLLVTDLSRLSRSQDLAPLLSRLVHRGVRVLGVQDGFDSESRIARMQAGMSGIMSEEFRRMIADRTYSALEIRARDGRPTGGKAYDEPEIVREMFGRFAAGETLKAIASDLNQRGIPSPGAQWKARSNPRGKWLVSAVRAVLMNERYAGRIIWNRSRWVKDPDSGRRVRRERPESEWVIRPCEPMIDAETWAAVQSRFRSFDEHSRAAKFLLSGILECGECGSKMVVSGGSHRRYRCGTNHAGGSAACAFDRTVPLVNAEGEILGKVQRDMLSEEAIAMGVREMRAERPKPAVRANRELLELERMVADGRLSPDVAAPAIEAARRKAPVVDAPFGFVVPTPAVWRETVRDMREILGGDDVGAARDVLRSLLGPVRILPGDPGYVRAEFTAGEIMLATGTGRFCGSGGVLRQILPISTRFRRS